MRRPITRPITVGVTFPDDDEVELEVLDSWGVEVDEVINVDGVAEEFEADVSVAVGIDEEPEETGALTLNSLE